MSVLPIEKPITNATAGLVVAGDETVGSSSEFDAQESAKTIYQLIDRGLVTIRADFLSVF